MMTNAEGKINNINLLNNSYGEYADQPTATNLVDTLTANRPLADSDEARMTARSLNQIMAFVEFGLSEKDLPRISEHDIYAGLQEIISACRLMSLRVEQFMDIESDRQEEHILNSERRR